MRPIFREFRYFGTPPPPFAKIGAALERPLKDRAPCVRLERRKKEKEKRESKRAEKEERKKEKRKKGESRETTEAKRKEEAERGNKKERRKKEMRARSVDWGLTSPRALFFAVLKGSFLPIFGQSRVGGCDLAAFPNRELWRFPKKKNQLVFFS